MAHNPEKNILQTVDKPSSESGDKESQNKEQEKISLGSYLDENRPFLRHWAGDSSVEIISTENAPEIEQQVPRAGIDLESGKMYINSEFYKTLELDEKMYLPLHEFGHFLGLKELLSDEKGARLWKKNEARNKKHQRYAILDNNFWDIQINRNVDERAPVLKSAHERIYKEKIFPERDFTNQPKHIQFISALDCWGNIPNDNFTVSDDVRAEFEKLKNIRSRAGVSLLDYATAPQTSQKMRIRLQEKYLYPVLDKFFKEDAENEEKKEKQKEAGEGEKKKSGQGEEGREKDKEKGENKNGGKESKKDSVKGGEKPKNPEDYFKEHYDKLKKNRPKIISSENLEKAAKKYLEKKSGQPKKTLDELAEEAYAKAEGITPEELREYRKFWQEVENITDPETSESVVEQLRKMFQKIINERKKEKYFPKYPVKEGELLAFPAKAVVDIKSGTQEPEVWETVEKKKRPAEMYGDFDVTLVADRSCSMTENEKYIEQRKAAALVLEALKDFCGDLDKARQNLEYDLNVRTECRSFGDEKQVEILKPLSKELTEKQRVYVYKKLADAPGKKTYDFLTLEKIRDNIPEEDLEKLEKKKLKKFIIVMSDGQSHGVDRVQEVLKDLREKGVVVVGVGITKSGKAIVNTYAPDGQVCESPADLPGVLGELLKEQLKDL